MVGQRHTAQRERIYEAVRGSQEHPSAETVFAQLRETMPRLSLGTVYRNLQLLTESGVLIRLEGTPVRFDARTAPHSHFLCTACGALLDAPGGGYDAKLDDALSAKGFQVERHELCFYGICPACAGKI